jgi:hypothetical protein
MMRVNHDRNFEDLCTSLANGTHTVIVDNTNIQEWHFQRYVDEAVEQGYVVQEVVGQFTRRAAEEYAARSLHDVPLDKVTTWPGDVAPHGRCVDRQTQTRIYHRGSDAQ